MEYNQRHSYVGTSLSKCVISILDGEMDYDNVIGMITNTRIKDESALRQVIDGYFEDGTFPDALPPKIADMGFLG